MCNRKVLLINPNRMRPPVVPIGLDYLSSALQSKGFEVDVLDLCFAEDVREAIEAYLGKNEVGAVGISVRNTDDCYFLSQDFVIPQIKEVIDCLRSHIDAPLVLGGVGFSVMPEAILDFCGVEWGIRGDGEWAFPALLEAFAQGTDPFGILGLVYRTSDGCRSNPPDLPDLDRLPLPVREAVDNPRYFREGGMGAVETKRGCAKRCIYCADPLAKGRRYRLRPPRLVADEVEALLEKGIDHLHLCDSEFNLPPEHAREVCRELIARGLGEKVRWYAYLSPAPFSEELASLMVRAGCVGADFGVDHGGNRMLRRLGRDFSREDLTRTAQICKQYGITFMYDLLFGGPGETRDTIWETIKFMQTINPSRVGISTGIRVYPGTPLARMVLREGPIEKNPNLHGAVAGNPHFFRPVFYISSAIGRDLIPCVGQLVAGDERFFLGAKEDLEANYNYNDNSVLVEAIRQGYRGAFWDILRQVGGNL